MVCEEGQVEIVKILLEHGANLEARDRNAYTSQLNTVNYCNEDIVDCLISFGAKFRVKDEDDNSFIDLARRALSRQARKHYQTIIDLASRDPEIVKPRQRKLERGKSYNEEGKCIMGYIIDPGTSYMPNQDKVDRAAGHREKIDERLKNIRRILNNYEVNEASRYSEALLCKIADIHSAQ